LIVSIIDVILHPLAKIGQWGSLVCPTPHITSNIRESRAIIHKCTISLKNYADCTMCYDEKGQLYEKSLGSQ